MPGSRFSRLVLFWALILVTFLAGCANTARSTSGHPAADEWLSITVDNQSPAPVVVYFTSRLGAPYVQLGRVRSIEHRVFRLPAGSVNGAKLELRAIHGRTLHNATTDYMTLPIDVAGVREVRWLIQDGRSLSPVIVR